MADKERMSPQASRESDPDDPEADRGDLTPPHGDELRAEGTFGRTDRYADYFHNSQRATEAHRRYCVQLSNRFPAYGPDTSAHTP